MFITKRYKQLFCEAQARILTLPLEEAKARLDSPDAVFVDINWF
jgi:hypothetical protein